MKRPLGRGERILAVDVGAGTQDILLFDPKKEPENNLKVVLPSQTQILAKRISNIKDDVVITGETMGGGPLAMAILRHLKKGFRVVMTETSARTVRDDLDEVREKGIEIVSEKVAMGLKMKRIETRDVDLEFIYSVMENAGEPLPDFIGIAVQDHGFEKGKSDRAFRFEKIKETLEKKASLSDFIYQNPPDHYTRMNAVLQGLSKRFKGGIAVLDSKFAAISGALHGTLERPCLCIDVGNGHTMAAVVDEGIDGLFEHHTHALNKKKLVSYLKRFADGDVTNNEVFNDNGHGCYIRKAPGLKGIKRIIVSGPNRSILKNSSLKVEFAGPFGDVMMTGPVGIVDLIRSKYL